MTTKFDGSVQQLVRFPTTTNLSSLVPVYTLDVQDERADTLRGLLQKGHTAVAPLREPKLILQSPPSSYFLSATAQQLEALYEHEITPLREIDDTFIPGSAISRDTWRAFLGKKLYTVSYVQYFDEELKRNNGDWKKLLQEYLAIHPFIHLAYAWELQSPTVTTETMSLGCTENMEAHGLLENYPPDNSTYKTSSLADIIKRIHDDKRFDGLFEYQGITNIDALMQQHFQALENICDTSVMLATATGDRERKFDFYLVRTMTVAHALRVLWELFLKTQQVCIRRQYALFVSMVYIRQLKPEVDFDLIHAIDSVHLGEGDDWDSIVKRALQHKWMKDSHFFKVIQAPKAFEEKCETKNDFYRKASLKFLAEFDGWEGFGRGVEGFLPNRDGYKPE
ncbi:hypothetical protein AnigIFM60653_011944 [Aspergillus niger]|nr:hypothetical protein AnigIFM60653_011944 [Aspergillus niger]GLA21559.1 hypothetical protein AnigIFM62618_011228 [Aspergillus niger]